MKTILALLALASVVSAAEEYLVVYEEKVRCYTCNFTNSVACSPNEPDCGIPWITRELIETFSTEAEAIRFVNRTNGQTTTLAVFATFNVPVPRNLPENATFKKLYRATPIALKVKTITTPEPPPPPKVITIYEKP